MTIENIKQRIDGLQGNDHSSFEELEKLAELMRLAAADIMTDAELSFLFDECAARIECLLAMAKPGLKRVEECIGLLATTIQLKERGDIHDQPEVMQ